MKSIITIMIATVFLGLSAATTKADITPDYVRDNFALVHETPCRDRITEDLGYCYMFIDQQATYYMVFVQDGQPVFIRQVLEEGGYETLWTAETVLGIAL